MPTTKELSERAQSLAYSQYKKLKRHQAKEMAKRRLLWIMSIVKCKVFATKLKKKWKIMKEKREADERFEEEERRQMLLN